MTTAGVADDLSLHTILLSGEGKCGEGSHADGGDVGGVCGVCLVAKLKADIPKTERFCVRVGWWLRMFSRSEQEKETKCGQIGCSK